MTALALTVGVVGTVGSTSASASAAAPLCGSVHVVASFLFDKDQKQTPENIVQEPDGSFDVTFSLNQQVARVGADGTVEVLATMPLPDDGGIKTPILGVAATMGLVRSQDGTLYFLYAAGDKKLTGVWRLRPHEVNPEQIAHLPADSLPNGLALDERSGALYLSDSHLGVVWTVPSSGGNPTVFSDDGRLAAPGFGANGLKIHDHAVWVSNSDEGTILRIPVLRGNRAGHPEVRATGLSTVDDFAFTGHGDELLAAVNGFDEVVRVHPKVHPDGTYTTVLEGQGLHSPTSLVLGNGTAFVASAAYKTHTKPNILAVPLRDGH